MPRLFFSLTSLSISHRFISHKSLIDEASHLRLGVPGHKLFASLQRRIRETIKEKWGLSHLYDAGTLFTRIEGEPRHDEWDMEPGHKYWNLHIDKANRHSYDYSAILYLNSHCKPERDDRCDFSVDFSGGGLTFQDNDSDLTIEPVAGRLVTFTGGLENLHTVQEVFKGTRGVLALWFTCREPDRYIDKDAMEPRPLQTGKPALRKLPPAAWPDISKPMRAINATKHDCGFPGITEEACAERRCAWDNSTHGVPWCFVT